MYIFRSDNRLEVPITLHLFKGMAEEVALVDSGATENFIDQETVKKLKLGSKKLSELVQLRNIDRTYNQSGSVTHYSASKNWSSVLNFLNVLEISQELERIRTCS